MCMSIKIIYTSALAWEVEGIHGLQICHHIENIFYNSTKVNFELMQHH